MKYFTKKIIAVLLTVMLTGITVLHVSGGQTIKEMCIRDRLIAVAVAAGIMTASSVYGICASVWKYCKKEI